MCGIAGIAGMNQGMEESERILASMCSAIRHRGPDNEGLWFDADARLGLGHCRLSILDLSPAGNQPMHSTSGRYVTVYNGEIYNYREIRSELEALAHRQWRGQSDTEVMLEAFENWGVYASVQRFVGMFAIALWDRKERILYLIRDRMGEKPLYYGWMGDTFLFGSELKALRNHPSWEEEISRDALTLLLRHSYIPAPYSIYRNVYKLPPGSILTIKGCCGGAGTMERPTPHPYWAARDAVDRGFSDPYRGTEREAVRELDRLLRDAVRLQMVADVPIGAFLSGGVDSSAVVSLMQTQSSRPVRTFTIGFEEESYNEAKHAKRVARHLGTDHTELYVSPDDTRDVIPRLPTLYDEPFADSSQIPTFLVCQLTRRFVTVSLSGDGGDELFGGYGRYRTAIDIWRKIGWIPSPIRKFVSARISFLPDPLLDILGKISSPVSTLQGNSGSSGKRLREVSDIIGMVSAQDLYRRLVSHWKVPGSIVRGGTEPLTALTRSYSWPRGIDYASRMMFLDMVSYLPDDILVKVDRAAMGVSLETRIPLLDHRVVEFAWRIPPTMKIRGTESKWLLRQVLYQYVPKHLIERPKSGFGVPIDIWLRGPLRDWAESLLEETRIRSEGFFDPVPIREKWKEHLSGERDWHYYLWDILIFQAWLENQRSSSA